jgi:hypothetical protein
MTAPASGRLNMLTWGLPQGEPTTLDYAQAGDYSPDFVISPPERSVADAPELIQVGEVDSGMLRHLSSRRPP